jgi:hypothetical protein
MKKIPTMFKRNPERMSEILPELHPDCDWVANGEGLATRKYDGTCCKIDEIGYWKRREVKKGKPDPDGFILEQHDENTGNRVGWVLVDAALKENQWHMEAYVDGLEYGTYELCGPKVQGNPENYSRHELVAHTDAEKLEDAPRSFDGLRDYLLDKDIEGLVFHHPDGRMAKIKKRDYGQKRK